MHLDFTPESCAGLQLDLGRNCQRTNSLGQSITSWFLMCLTTAPWPALTGHQAYTFKLVSATHKDGRKVTSNDTTTTTTTTTPLCSPTLDTRPSASAPLDLPLDTLFGVSCRHNPHFWGFKSDKSLFLCGISADSSSIPGAQGGGAVLGSGLLQCLHRFSD